MNKGLEAFNKFCDDVNASVNSGGIHYIDIRNKEIVEKELKRLYHFEEVVWECLLRHKIRSIQRLDKVLEIIKKYPNNRNSLANFRYMVGYWEKNNVEVTKELLETYDFPFEIDEYDLLKEVLL